MIINGFGGSEMGSTGAVNAIKLYREYHGYPYGLQSTVIASVTYPLTSNATFTLWQSSTSSGSYEYYGPAVNFSVTIPENLSYIPLTLEITNTTANAGSGVWTLVSGTSSMSQGNKDGNYLVVVQSVNFNAQAFGRSTTYTANHKYPPTAQASIEGVQYGYASDTSTSKALSSFSTHPTTTWENVYPYFRATAYNFRLVLVNTYGYISSSYSSTMVVKRDSNLTFNITAYRPSFYSEMS